MTPQNPYPKHSNEHEQWKLERLGFNHAQIRIIQEMERKCRPEQPRTDKNNVETVVTFA